MNVDVDTNALLNIVALQRPNKPNLLERVVGLFESESPKCIAQVVDGVAAGDLESIRIGSHTLKSSCANLGAVSLSARCRDIEKAARSGDLATCTELAQDLVAEFDASAQVIRQFQEQAA